MSGIADKAKNWFTEKLKEFNFPITTSTAAEKLSSLLGFELPPELNFEFIGRALTNPENAFSFFPDFSKALGVNIPALEDPEQLFEYLFDALPKEAEDGSTS